MTGWSLVRERARLADTVVALSATLLSLLCLIPLYADLRWVLPALLVVVVVCALGAGSRAIALPVPVVPLVELLGIVGTITVLFVSDEAWGRVLPTSSAWSALRDLAGQGMLDAQTFTSPVATMPELVLLGVGGAGLAALCIDTLFVSVRSPMLAGVPILVLFVGSTLLLFGNAPWWGFVPPATAWLLILAADQREHVREWGRLPSTVRVRGLSTVARRVGGTAIAVALLAAVVLPVRAVSGSGGGIGDGPGDGPGAAAGIVLDPLVTMRRSLTQQTDSEVLRYRSDDPNPTYLRVTALESFDGTTWRERPGLESGRDPGWTVPGIINAPGDSATSTYDITVTNLQNAFLPLPFPAAAIDNVAGIEAGWRFDPATGVAFSDGIAASGVHYRVTAIDPIVNANQLRAATLPQGALWPQLNYPSGLPTIVKRTAEQVTARADTPYDKALALQNYFARDGGFRYSTSVRSGAGADYLAEFLMDKVGYCEQYAAAMAVMARTLGIPSRVMVGFTQGTLAEDGSWVVTVRDAHAWPELWFDGAGWVRFEPTPRADSVRTPDYAPASSQLPGRNADDTRGQLDSEGFDPVAVDRGTDVRAIINRIMLAVVLVVGLGLLLMPGTRRVVRRRRRLHGGHDAAVVEGAWQEVGATAIDLGQPWSAFSTPRQAAERLSRGMSEPAAAALRRLRVQVEQVRYSRPAEAGALARSAMAERSAAVRVDVRTVQRELRGRVRTRGRLASYCWPPSERRRQRSSMRSMKPADLREVGVAALVPVTSSTGRVRKAE